MRAIGEVIVVGPYSGVSALRGDTVKTLDERISALETAVSYISSQVDDVKRMLTDIKSELADRKVNNGVQNATLEQHKEEIREIREDFSGMIKRIDKLTRFVYIGLGILSTIVFLAQVVPLFLNLVR